LALRLRLNEQAGADMKRIALAFLFTALAAFTLSAAGKNKPKDVPADGHIDPYVHGPADEPNLIREVRHNLVSLPYFGVFDDLGFTVNGSTVTLVGEVAQPFLKDDAERVTKKVEGVTNVINNIEVLPLSPFDDGIRRRVFHAIYGDPQLSMKYGYSAIPSIHIIVKNGNVRLEGVVANQMDKQIAGMRANGVPGVFQVVNSLRVESGK
jgi:hyperosmotically inducible protein